MLPSTSPHRMNLHPFGCLCLTVRATKPRKRPQWHGRRTWRGNSLRRAWVKHLPREQLALPRTSFDRTETKDWWGAVAVNGSHDPTTTHSTRSPTATTTPGSFSPILDVRRSAEFRPTVWVLIGHRLSAERRPNPPSSAR